MAIHQNCGNNGNGNGNGNNRRCPEGCCTGEEILCISIPCPVQIVILGLELELNIPCISLGANQDLTDAQLQQILELLRGLLGGIVDLGTGQSSQGYKL